MPLVVNCPHCKSALQIPDGALGQTVRCVKCNNTLKVAGPPAPPPVIAPDPGRIEPPALTPTPASPPERDPFEGHDIPEDMREEIRAELTSGERIVWVERPVGAAEREVAGFEVREGSRVAGSAVRTVSVQYARGNPPATDSNVGKIVVGAVLAVIGLSLVIGALYCGLALKKDGWLIALIPGLGSLIFLGAGLAVLIDLYLSGKRRQEPARGACYVLTNRRALIHLGGVPGKPRFRSYYGPQLVRMKPAEIEEDGSGSLVFDLGEPGIGGEPLRGFLGVRDVRKVEKLLRTTLVDRPAPARGRPEPLATDQSETALVEAGLTARERQQVADELGRNEKVIWAGRPDPIMVVGRLRWVRIPIFSIAATLGLVLLFVAGPPWGGAAGVISWGILVLLTTAASFLPQYHGWMARRTFYVITSRRALVWKCQPNFTTQLVEYLGPEVCRMRREDVPEYGAGAGDLVFRSKVVITIHTGGGPGASGPSTDIQHFGFLSLRDAATVERLIREQLIHPSVDTWASS